MDIFNFFAGVGKSSLLLRFSDNTFSGKLHSATQSQS